MGGGRTRSNTWAAERMGSARQANKTEGRMTGVRRRRGTASALLLTVWDKVIYEGVEIRSKEGLTGNLSPRSHASPRRTHRPARPPVHLLTLRPPPTTSYFCPSSPASPSPPNIHRFPCRVLVLALSRQHQSRSTSRTLTHPARSR